MVKHWLEGSFQNVEEAIREKDFVKLNIIHTMRSLKIMCESQTFNNDLKMKYNAITVNQSCSLADKSEALSQIVMGLDFFAALQVMQNNCHDAEATALIRVAVISWYYSIYHAARAMLILQDGSRYENHSQLANSWDAQLASKNLIIKPFDFRFSSLVKGEVQRELDGMLDGEKYNNQIPENDAQARTCYLTLLSGSAKWYREKFERKMKIDAEFKSKFPKFKDFRNLAARQYKDDKISKKCCGFIHHAYRIRGKANYRDALYLSYRGADDRMPMVISDIVVILFSFYRMVVMFSSKKAGNDMWELFMRDKTKNKLTNEILDNLYNSRVNL